VTSSGCMVIEQPGFGGIVWPSGPMRKARVRLHVVTGASVRLALIAEERDFEARETVSRNCPLLIAAVRGPASSGDLGSWAVRTEPVRTAGSVRTGSAHIASVRTASAGRPGRLPREQWFGREFVRQHCWAWRRESHQVWRWHLALPSGCAPRGPWCLTRYQVRYNCCYSACHSRHRES
jgi:hypothetical protein